ncbi:MAG TPA: hypothetical protein VNR87_03350 [Flavisolibacter sp.]|nr:hypothetical protein [Flavisolibacter sp.]
MLLGHLPRVKITEEAAYHNSDASGVFRPHRAETKKRENKRDVLFRGAADRSIVPFTVARILIKAVVSQRHYARVTKYFKQEEKTSNKKQRRILNSMARIVFSWEAEKLRQASLQALLPECGESWFGITRKNFNWLCSTAGLRIWLTAFIIATVIFMQNNRCFPGRQ